MSDFQIRRDGDVWSLGWDAHRIGMSIERIKESSDGLKAEVTVESVVDGRVLGPVQLNLLSAQSQKTFSVACFERVNGLSKEIWTSMVVQACSIVTRQYRQPAPTVDLSEEPDPGPVQYLIPGLVPKAETTVLYGDGEGGKSLLALCIGMCVVMGDELPWGSRVAVPGNVLYLDWETNQQTLTTRLRRLAKGSAVEVPKMFYRQCFRSLGDELPSIREEISRKNIVLVIVDSIGFAASGSLNEDETARSAMNALRQMTPATRLVVAHVSKGSAESTGPVKPFGSAFFWNGMRSGIEVRRSEETSNDNLIDMGVFHRKSNDGRHVRPFGLSVVFEERDNGGILIERTDIQDVPDLAARTPASTRIRALLLKGSSDTKLLAEDLNMSESDVYRALKRMPDIQPLQSSGKNGAVRWGLVSDLRAADVLP